MLDRACIVTQRIVLSAWVGAAVLFVVTSVAEQQFAGFSPAMKNQLALIRFPKYYAFGFIAVLVGLGCSVCRVCCQRERSHRIVLGLLGVTLALMIIDYVFVYSPLVDLMEDFSRPRDDTFRGYHSASKYINATSILLVAVASVLACRTPRPDASPPASGSSSG